MFDLEKALTALIGVARTFARPGRAAGSQKEPKKQKKEAPDVGLEPTTTRLRVVRSAD